MATAVQTTTRSPAEIALIEEAGRGIDPGTSRHRALDKLREAGLPGRKVEAWHYTDLRTLIGRLSGNESAPSRAAADDSLFAPLLAGSHVIELAGEASLPTIAGATVGPQESGPDWSVAPNHLDRAFDTIRLLSAAFGARGAKVEVAKGANLDAPVEFRSTPGGGGHGIVAVEVGADASATFVERLEGEGSGLPSTGVSELRVGDRSEVLWIVDQNMGPKACHLGQLNVTVGEDAVFKLFVLNAGGALVRYEVHSRTEGEGSETRIRGVNLLEAGQHIDLTTTLYHVSPNTSATETLRNVLTGGHGVFQGLIKVAQGAQKTDAKMACNTLLLSDDGDFSAKPELEIFADDVQCGHGATAGEINSEHLFYLMSRGIPKRIARALLIKAFVAEVVEELEAGEEVEEALTTRIDAWLERDSG